MVVQLKIEKLTTENGMYTYYIHSDVMCVPLSSVCSDLSFGIANLGDNDTSFHDKYQGFQWNSAIFSTKTRTIRRGGAGNKTCIRIIPRQNDALLCLCQLPRPTALSDPADVAKHREIQQKNALPQLL